MSGTKTEFISCPQHRACDRPSRYSSFMLFMRFLHASPCIKFHLMQPLATSMLHDAVLLHLNAGLDARADMVLPEEFEDDYLLMESLDLPASTLPR